MVSIQIDVTDLDCFSFLGGTVFGGGSSVRFRPALWGYQSYQVVPARIMNHPALLHHSGAPPLGVFNGLDHPHQRDVAAGGGATHTHTHTQDLTD